METPRELREDESKRSDQPPSCIDANEPPFAAATRFPCALRTSAIAPSAPGANASTAAAASGPETRRRRTRGMVAQRQARRRGRGAEGEQPPADAPAAGARTSGRPSVASAAEILSYGWAAGTQCGPPQL